MVHPTLSLGWLLALTALASGWEQVTGGELESSLEQHDVLVAACKFEKWVKRTTHLRILANTKSPSLSQSFL